MDWLLPESPDELADVLRERSGPGRRVLVTGAPRPPDELPPGASGADAAGADGSGGASPAGADPAAGADGGVGSQPPGPGPGTAVDGPPPDAVVSTARLSGVLEHRPRDLTVTVGAGTRVAELHRRLAETGTWVPLSGPAAELSVGGAVASAVPGPHDTRHGDLRRQLLACELVTWSGDRTRWGRGVMKNVAGYGMTRVLAGSSGRLGVVHRATFRLWPAPGARRTAVLEPGDGRGLDAAGRLARSDLDAEVRPDAVVWRRAGGGAGERLEIHLLGSSDSVDLRLDRLRSWAADSGLAVGAVTSSPPAGGEAEARADGPFGRDRDAALSAAWAAPGRGRFARAAGAAEQALGDDLVSLEGYPLSGHLRCAWRGEAAGRGGGPGDGSAGPVPGGRRDPGSGGAGPSPRDAAAAPDAGSGAGAGAAGALGRLLDALSGAPVRLERGGPAELAAADARRDESVRRLEVRVVEALGGRGRDWLSGYL